MTGRRRDAADPFRPARWVDLVAAATGRVSGRPLVRLDVGDLRRRAARQLDRPVVSDDPGLDVLVADAATAGLTDLGRLGVRAQLVRRIVTAERLADTLMQWPQLDDVQLPRPLVIVGLPRTGTTLLHGLLACDGGAFAPRFWQLQQPTPPPAGRVDSGVRYAKSALTVSLATAMMPRLRHVHPVATRQPEECVFLFRDVGTYAVAFPAFGYLRWLQGEGAAAVDYRSYRRHLQALLSTRSGQRPVLKSPFHLGHLDDLLAALPDALVVHTHREPTAALASWCSLAATIGRATVASLDLAMLGQAWLDFWAHAAERAVTVRATADAGRFHDVRYSELVADPLHEVRRLYAITNLELTPSAQQRMERWLERHHRNRRAQHRYRLDQFGLEAATVEARFHPYQSM